MVQRTAYRTRRRSGYREDLVGRNWDMSPQGSDHIDCRTLRRARFRAGTRDTAPRCPPRLRCAQVSVVAHQGQPGRSGPAEERHPGWGSPEPAHLGRAAPAQEPALGSRRLHAGHHLGSQQASSLIPGQQLEPGFDDVPTLSTRYQRFTRVRLPCAHLTGLSRLFRNAHYPSHWAGAACGGLDPGPAARVRGACPRLLCSKAASGDHCCSLLSAPSWRTVIGIAHETMPPLLQRSVQVCEHKVGQQRR